MLYGSTERCLIEGAYKVMYDEQGDQWKLYDVSADAAETIDLSSRLPRHTESMRQHLIEWHARLQRDYQAARREHPSPDREPDYQTELDALRALGYISDG